MKILHLAQRIGVTLDKTTPSEMFQKMILKRLEQLEESFDHTLLQETIRFVDMADRLELQLDDAPIQNRIYSILTQKIEPWVEEVRESNEGEINLNAVSDFLQLVHRFNFNTAKYQVEGC